MYNYVNFIESRSRKILTRETMDRRNFLMGLSSFSLATLTIDFHSASAEPGISAAPDLYSSISRLRGVAEGAGRGVMHILYTPWCSMSPELYKDMRPFLGRIRINWIPFSGGQPEGQVATELLLRSGSPADIPKYFTELRTLAPIDNTPLSDAQDVALSEMLPLYYRDVGGSLKTPTVFYRMTDDRIRVVKGAPQQHHIEQIVQVAS